MRTAVVLLVLLALAAIPGSLLPQRGVATDPAAVAFFVRDHPVLAPWLDRFWLFEVYSAPWFAAIYVLLLVSMTGCVLPRCAKLWRDYRAEPPAAPSNLHLENGYAEDEVADAEEALNGVERHLRGHGFRVVRTDGEVRAEKGRVRELGNLCFHLSLLVLLLGVACGRLLGYEGRVAVVEGQTFTNVASSYDALTPSPWTDLADLEPLSFTLDTFTARFETAGARIGEPREFTADLSVATPEGGEESVTVRPNQPLEVEGTKFFLTGHGYAPQVTVRDGSGAVVVSGPTIFLPRDPDFTSDGVIKAPGAQPEQLALEGLFAPTAATSAGSVMSVFPDTVAPQLQLSAWTGDLGLSDGAPQSVFTLDYDDLTEVTLDGQPWRATLEPGQSVTLPDGLGSVTFDGVSRFANFQVARDPGKEISLLAAVLLLGGLTVSLAVPRRRVWVRRTGPHTVAVAGRSLSRREAPLSELLAIRAVLSPPEKELAR